MKNKILFATIFGVAFQMGLGNYQLARVQAADSVLDSVIKSMGSSQQDKSRNDNYDSDRDSRYGDRHQRDDRDDGDRHSRRDGNDPDQIVRRAYEDVLNREPDKEGLRVYRSRIIDDNWSEKDVRNALRKSEEASNQNSESIDNIVRRAYQDVLGRDPDRAGLATYRMKMMNEGWSERDVRSDLKKSSERREKGDVSSEQAQQIVRRAYRSTLGRDADSGSSVYVDKVMRNHWSEEDVAKELRNSAEYRNKHKK